MERKREQKDSVDKLGKREKRVESDSVITTESDRVETIGKRKVRVLTLKLDENFLFKYPR